MCHCVETGDIKWNNRLDVENIAEVYNPTSLNRLRYILLIKVNHMEKILYIWFILRTLTVVKLHTACCKLISFTFRRILWIVGWQYLRNQLKAGVAFWLTQFNTHTSKPISAWPYLRTVHHHRRAWVRKRAVQSMTFRSWFSTVNPY